MFIYTLAENTPQQHENNIVFCYTLPDHVVNVRFKHKTRRTWWWGSFRGDGWPGKKGCNVTIRRYALLFLGYIYEGRQASCRNDWMIENILNDNKYIMVWNLQKVQKQLVTDKTPNKGSAFSNTAIKTVMVKSFFISILLVINYTKGRLWLLMFLQKFPELLFRKTFGDRWFWNG